MKSKDLTSRDKTKIERGGKRAVDSKGEERKVEILREERAFKLQKTQLRQTYNLSRTISKRFG